MKKKSLEFIFVLFVLVGISSCSDFETEVVPRGTYNSIEVYPELTDFQKEVNGYLNLSYRETNAEPVSDKMHDDLLNGKRDFFVDARTEDGYSTWSQPKFSFSGSSDVSATVLVKKRENMMGSSIWQWAASSGESYLDHKHIYKDTIVLSTPPVHLHLCLDSWDQSIAYKPQKTWVTVSVTDENGGSLVNDRNWGKYMDNSLTFFKATKFSLDLGTQMTDFEKEKFGDQLASKDKNVVYGTYQIVENDSKKIKLILTFPKWPREFEVVESSWTSLTLKGTEQGKVGIVKFKPME